LGSCNFSNFVQIICDCMEKEKIFSPNICLVLIAAAAVSAAVLLR
jgi:hypothetical protein